MRPSVNRWPARVDVLQSASGLLLVLFIWGHMFFESSILLGHDAMYLVAKAFEGQPLLSEPHPELVSIAGGTVLMLIALHALLALRKFPATWRQYRELHGHLGRMRHWDSTLWYVQVITGFFLFFLAAAHLSQMMLQPEDIGPYASADRIWSDHYWLLYAPLLLTVHLHAAIGVYRLAMKWGPFSAATTDRWRGRARLLMVSALAFFLCLGTASLVTYMRLGAEHAPYKGERYTPSWERE
ncbi:fumarate reductase cytochrome b subunit [Mangrovimicrobium sediminis]|uniref:Fumarate reductase cytochrome b subunit n=1 Tax=Mangrovimicrobium sediminis TaxID=2562682 RepID=A0A4Z0M4Z0_9GAMM|nr:fumarate reductase cytochrome b subunit [Haliea sp. SAOS-164]TGD74763.1 fumarate reductase cytochrome b subunit [Haliea sp. SAOS-164]